MMRLKNILKISCSLIVLSTCKSKYVEEIQTVQEKNLAYSMIIGSEDEVKNLLNSAYSTIDENAILTMSYLDRVYSISKEAGYEECMADALHLKGVVYYKQKHYLAALQSFAESLAINQKLKRSKSIGESYKWTGITYHDTEFYNIAEEYYNLAINEYAYSLDSRNVSEMQRYIAILYQDQKDYTTAAFHLNIALEMAQRARDQKQIAKCHNTKGVINQLKEKLDDAIVEHEKAVYYAHEASDAEFEAEMYNNLGNDYRLKGDLIKSLQCYNESLKYKNLMVVGTKIDVLLNAAILLTQSNRFKEAEEYLFEAVFLADQNQSYADLRDIKKELGRMYKRKGDDEKSEYYYLQSDELDDQIKAEIKKVSDFLTNSKMEILRYNQHLLEKGRVEVEERKLKRWLVTASLLSMALGMFIYKVGSKIRKSYKQHKQEERLKNKVISEVSRLVQEQEQKNDNNTT